ncbi:hypothetical protein FZC78_03765 [Rossellomorea vietnamensis]|uniref:Uncharacterized protein n=1 Tax=Rossellomorea vietnamensis TaxID=218284 RepID=A0A5D4NYN6_9BACI|nr:hypothetical protein [Rossellomorea vietnamensis]TYS18648.1 hypothetical protein FZC78_03765 [Rossellomorea vietnamensis]
MRFLRRYGHWLFLAVTSLSTLSGLYYFTLRTSGLVAFFFSFIGLAAVGCLCVEVERKKKIKEQK